METRPEGHITIRDVGPRDGLQSAQVALPTKAKIRLIEVLAAAGLTRCEIGSMVSPKAVPTMADTGEILAGTATLGSLRREVLVVNTQGAQRAIAAGADTLVVVVAASDTFSHHNVRMSTSDAIRQASLIHELARSAGIGCVADVATAFGCAYEGKVTTGQVRRVVDALVGDGYRELTLADTVGWATPPAVTRLIGAIVPSLPSEVVVGLHLHDTAGLGLVNAMAGVDDGIRLFDASIGGIGGCPFSPGASGNVCTEDLVNLFEATGWLTGIDLGALVEAARTLAQDLGYRLPGHLASMATLPFGAGEPQ